MAPGDLQEVLEALKPAGRAHPDLLVGLAAAGVIAGGHTVVDNEPKYGLCVTGRVHPDRILIKGGLRPGDRLFLSKPLGTGVITTAAKDNAARAEVLDGAIKSMLRLNRV